MNNNINTFSPKRIGFKLLHELFTALPLKCIDTSSHFLKKM